MASEICFPSTPSSSTELDSSSRLSAFPPVPQCPRSLPSLHSCRRLEFPPQILLQSPTNPIPHFPSRALVCHSPHSARKGPAVLSPPEEGHRLHSILNRLPPTCFPILLHFVHHRLHPPSILTSSFLPPSPPPPWSIFPLAVMDLLASGPHTAPPNRGPSSPDPAGISGPQSPPGLCDARPLAGLGTCPGPVSHAVPLAPPGPSYSPGFHKELRPPDAPLSGAGCRFRRLTAPTHTQRPAGLAPCPNQAPPSIPAPVPGAAASRVRGRTGPRSRTDPGLPRRAPRQERASGQLRAGGAGDAGRGAQGRARGDGVPGKERRSETPAPHTKVPRLEPAALKRALEGWGWRLAKEKDLQKGSRLRASH